MGLWLHFQTMESRIAKKSAVCCVRSWAWFMTPKRSFKFLTGAVKNGLCTVLIPLFTVQQSHFKYQLLCQSCFRYWLANFQQLLGLLKHAITAETTHEIIFLIKLAKVVKNWVFQTLCYSPTKTSVKLNILLSRPITLLMWSVIGPLVKQENHQHNTNQRPNNPESIWIKRLCLCLFHTSGYTENALDC